MPFKYFLITKTISLILSYVAFFYWVYVVHKSNSPSIKVDISNNVLSADEEILFYNTLADMASALQKYRTIQCKFKIKNSHQQYLHCSWNHSVPQLQHDIVSSYVSHQTRQFQGDILLYYLLDHHVWLRDWRIHHLWR